MDLTFQAQGGVLVRDVTRQDPAVVAQFRDVPTSILSDCLDRFNALTGLTPIGEPKQFAGPAVTVEEIEGSNLMSHLALKYLKAGDGLVVFRASGSSMIEAQIADGDFLIVAENPDPPIGSVVIAVVGEQMLCKRLARRTKKSIQLAPCNGQLEPLTIDPQQTTFRILGVLRNVLRKV